MQYIFVNILFSPIDTVMVCFFGSDGETSHEYTEMHTAKNSVLYSMGVHLTPISWYI
jgi:hypothetical protein